jgi:hypothetical protein
MPRITALVATLVFAGMAVTARISLEPEASRLGGVRDPAWLPSGRSLRLASFGQRVVLADLYWLKLVQYMGETLLSHLDRWDAVAPLAEIVTDLDPRYGYAYQVTGSNLAGVAHRHAEASRILHKGMRNLPDRWQLYWIHAVDKFLYEGDFAEAAEYARQAAVIGKRPHLALLAANLALASDQDAEYRTTLEFLPEAIAQADTPELKAQLERRLEKVRTYAALSAVEHAVEAFQRRYGIRPIALDHLVWTGFLRAVPADPAGGGIAYDPATGKVWSTVLGERRPLRNTMAQEQR